jgi:5-hydroxyisourate hydrolase-like protein (transthyretin family)
MSAIILISILAGGALLAQDRGAVGNRLLAPASTPTCDPSCAPVPTPTADASWIYGVVLDQATGQGLAGASVRLYRSAGAGWNLLREDVTGPDGRFGFGISPATSGYRLVETDPYHYASVSARLAPGVLGNVVDANTLDFTLPTSALVGEFLFVDLWNPQDLPTLTPTPPAATTPSPAAKWIFGTVIDVGTGRGLAGATVRLYRSMGSGWELRREATTLADGAFGFGVSPADSGYRLTEEDPAEYDSVAAYLPATVSGTVVDLNTLDFSLPAQTGVGEFVFVDIWEGCVPTETSTPSPSSTPSKTPTATPSDELCYDALPSQVLIYRIVEADFYGYTLNDASLSPLIPVTSPPAPVGWNQPGFVPDSAWRAGIEVLWDQWSVPNWVAFPGAVIVGLADAHGVQEGLDGTTHLIRNTFQLVAPGPGMRLASVTLQMWSDNKTAWWWDGVLVVHGHEGPGGQVELIPAYVRPDGGTYTLAVQNSNDRQRMVNPQGTAFRICVTWARMEDATTTPTLGPTATSTPTLTPTATITLQRVQLPLVMLSHQ